jgi:hypothetical protein
MRRRACLLALALAGCLQPLEQIILVDERFEDGTASWTISGAVELVPTYHPGEHGLRFLGPARMERGISVVIYGEFQDGNWIEYTTSCGGVPGARVAPRLDGTWEVVLELPTAGDGTPDEFERVFVSVPPVPWSEWGSATLSLFTVVADGGGPCVIDNLRLVQPEPDSGW